MDTYFSATCPMPPSENDPSNVEKMAAIRDALAPFQCQLEKRLYQVTLTFHARWDNDDGTPAKRDVSNHDKYLLDVLRDTIGVDDRHFRRIVLEAVHREGEEYVEIEVSPL